MIRVMGWDKYSINDTCMGWDKYSINDTCMGWDKYSINKAIRDGKYIALPHASAGQRSAH